MGRLEPSIDRAWLLCNRMKTSYSPFESFQLLSVDQASVFSLWPEMYSFRTVEAAIYLAKSVDACADFLSKSFSKIC